MVSIKRDTKLFNELNRIDVSSDMLAICGSHSSNLRPDLFLLYINGSFIIVYVSSGPLSSTWFQPKAQGQRENVASRENIRLWKTGLSAPKMYNVEKY